MTEKTPSAASKYYSQHYEGLLRPGLTPLDEFQTNMMGPGKRYALAAEYFERHDPKGATLVELGCGGGEALTLLSRRHRFGKVLGLDVALPSDASTHERVEFINGDLDQAWPFDDHTVDFIVAMMLIEHLYDPFHAFLEMKRVLTQSGMAFVNLPLVTGIKNRARLAMGAIPVTSTNYKEWFTRREWDGNHLHYFSLPSIRTLATSVGLAVLDVRGVGRAHRLKTLLPTFLASEVTFALAHVSTATAA